MRERRQMTKIRYLGGSCVEIIGLREHVIIDPVYYEDPIEGVNIILISSDNPDHFQLKHLQQIMDKFTESENNNLQIYGPKSIKKKLKTIGRADQLKSIKTRGNLLESDLNIKAFNLTCRKEKKCHGFTITKRNVSILCTSSSISFSNRVKKIMNDVDYAFIPSFEDHNQVYFDFLLSINPKVIFPYHFKPGQEEAAKRMTEYMTEMGLRTSFIEIGTEFEF